MKKQEERKRKLLLISLAPLVGVALAGIAIGLDLAWWNAYLLAAAVIVAMVVVGIPWAEHKPPIWVLIRNRGRHDDAA